MLIPFDTNKGKSYVNWYRQFQVSWRQVPIKGRQCSPMTQKIMKLEKIAQV